ncbi:hypothetical protein JKF63_06162 [Porcisia hertigi]|uniref:MIF4G domain-containing protein n=1 Tax=Porcisia hertigi TaxID=2761500 RepID=A0A836LIU9_9TRYP|nr:hypothetical protein JKF63_06162 [Porcisia hertigi]
MRAFPYTSPTPATGEAKAAVPDSLAERPAEGMTAAAAVATAVPTEAVESPPAEAAEKQVAEDQNVEAPPAREEAIHEAPDESHAALPAAAATTALVEAEGVVAENPETDAPEDATVLTAADGPDTMAHDSAEGRTKSSLDCVAGGAPSSNLIIVAAAQMETDATTTDGGAVSDVVNSADRVGAETVQEAVAVKLEGADEVTEEAQRPPDAAEKAGFDEQDTAALPDDLGRDEEAEVAVEPSAAESTAPEDEPSVKLTQLRATCEMMAFDAAHIAEWMMAYRQETAHVPSGVQRFLHEFNGRADKLMPLWMGGISPMPNATSAAAKKGKKNGLASSTLGASRSGTSTLVDLPARDGGGFGTSASLRTGASVPVRKSNALEALSDVWEGRQEAPISLSQGSLRRRGLFGEVEKKKIHHLVVAVLNKVTTDPVKFREVKNELLRLPIPEANAEQLTKIVDAFFTKAVREQHFSHSYADLIVALCKVPQGQHIVGDKTQSLEYRLRMALLKRCQAEFVQSIRAEETDPLSSTATSTLTATDDVSSRLTAAMESAQAVGGETEKERRDRMCGNVRFVCELFLRDVVAASVISVIFRICCLGSEFGEFVVPPSYTPTESQVDEIITAVKTVKERYFVQSGEGRRMLPQLLSQLDYWMKHYTVSRCRFVLMSTVDDLRAMLPDDPASPPSMTLHITPQLTQSPPPFDCAEQGVLALACPAQSPAAAVPGVLGTADASRPLLMSSVMVGGQPLPAPRSKQVGSMSLSDSAGSINCMPPSQSPVTSVINRPILTLASRAALQQVRPEAIAKLMAAFSSDQCSAEEVAIQLFDTYGNVLPALAAWLNRCISVVKEEKTRKRTGSVLIACVTHLTAHTNAGSDEIAETVAACREQLHGVAMEALQRAISSKLYEDLRIFQFWAQLVLSDHARVIYDEELLNEGLELLVYTAPPAVRNYLSEVGKYMAQVLVAPEKLPWQASSEAQNFVRYRPLLVLHSLLMRGGPSVAQELLDNVISFSDVRQNSLELRIYHAFRTGSPSREVIFEELRTSPRVTSRDSTFPAEVLSALLIAELSSSGDAFVEDNMDLLQITVDGVVRAEREIALVAEVYEILRYTPRPMTMSAAARVLRKFVYMHIVSEETIERADRFYEAERDGAISKPTQEGGGALMAPPSAEYPRIMDRCSTDDAVLSGRLSVRSGNGAMGVSGHDGGNVNGGVAAGGGAGSVDGLQSSNASSFAEFHPRDSGLPRCEADSEQNSSRHSQRQLSPRRDSQSNSSFQVTRGGEDNSKRLYRNSYKNRRRSQGERGSEQHSNAGGSKDVSSPPQQPQPQPQQPMGLMAPAPTSNYAGSHEGGRHISGGRYDRQHINTRGGRGSGRGGGWRGNGVTPHRGGGHGDSGISREDSRRGSGGGGSRYTTRTSGGGGGKGG